MIFPLKFKQDGKKWLASARMCGWGAGNRNGTSDTDPSRDGVSATLPVSCLVNNPPFRAANHWCAGAGGGPSLASPSMLVALCCQTSKEQEMTPQTWHLFKELGLKTSLEPAFYESTGENPFFILSREKHRQSRCLGTKKLSWNWSFVALFDIGKNRGRLKKKMYSGNEGFWAQGDLCTLYIFCWFPQLSISLRAEGSQVP